MLSSNIIYVPVKYPTARSEMRRKNDAIVLLTRVNVFGMPEKDILRV